MAVMQIVLQWLFRLLAWLIREWIAGIVGLFFIVLGLLPSGVEGPAIMQFIQTIVSTEVVKLGFVAIGFFLMAVAVYQNFFSYAALKTELRNALDDLNSDNINVRLHAIEDILAVSRKSRRLHSRAMLVLANFVRARSPASAHPGRHVTITRSRLGRPTAAYKSERATDMHEYARTEYDVPRREVPVDVRKAVEAISRRQTFFDDPRQWIDLSEADLPCISLENLNIGKISFAGTNLRNARMDGADLRGAGFDCSIVIDATFNNAKLSSSSFFGCLGHRLQLDGADLRRATFSGADLYDASIQSSDARNTCFVGANMWRLSAGLANLTGAEFFNANLSGADLHHAKGLTKKQVLGENGFGAIVDKNTRLPWSTDVELEAAGMVILKQSHQSESA